MSTAGILVLVFATIVFPIGLMAFILIRTFGNMNKINQTTQRVISDQALIKLIADQPDGMMSAKQLVSQTDLSLQEARKRLLMLQQWGALANSTSSRLETYYSLTGPVEIEPPPSLSPEPFLTVDDILLIFKHFNYKVTPLQLVQATGLPLSIIKREINFFKKEKVIQLLTRTVGAHQYGGGMTSKTYVLMEPYRSDPDYFLQKEEKVNLELKELLKRENLL